MRIEDRMNLLLATPEAGLPTSPSEALEVAVAVSLFFVSSGEIPSGKK